jgi:hypothetical protein
MGADKVGVVGGCAEVARIGRAAFALPTGPDEPLPEQPAIGRPEVKLTDQRRPAERMKARPFGGIVGDRAPVAIEADDVAPAGAGLDRFLGLPGEAAAELEMAGIVTAQGFGNRPVIRIGEPPGECRQVADNGRVRESSRGQHEPGGAEVIPGAQRNPPGLLEPRRIAIGFRQIGDERGIGRALRSGGERVNCQSVVLLRVGGRRFPQASSLSTK